MKQIILLLGVIMYLQPAEAQRKIHDCPKVFYYAAEISDTSCNHNIKNVRQTASRKILIKYKDQSKVFISEDSIWGIRRQSGITYRIVGGTDYKLEETSPLYKYSRRIGKSTRYYFSAAAEAPVYRYRSELLKKYADSATFNALVRESKQNRHEISSDILAVNAKVLNNNISGPAFGIKYFPYKRWGTGIMLFVAARNISDTFRFSVIRPQFGYYEFAWTNEYRFIDKDRLLLGIQLSTGLSIAQIRDKAVLVKTTSRARALPKEITTDYYFLLKPEIRMSYKLISNKHNPDFFLTTNIGQSYNFGSNSFNSTGTLSALTFSVGISMIGWDKMQF